MANEQSGVGLQYLGLDFSTQQLKAIVIDDELNVVHEQAIDFSRDLPHFKTKDGVILNGKEARAPPLMWVEGLDLLLHRMKQGGTEFSRIVSISGAGQQHGSVFWKKGTQAVLRNLDSNHSLHEQLKNAFSVTLSPIWMDSSTTLMCREMESSVGGANMMAKLTGSRAFERFTASQIKKVRIHQVNKYDDTERIGLVSSAMCSLLLGDYAPIDWSDGSGMNLLDISEKVWNWKCASAVTPDTTDLLTKLSEPVNPCHALGNVSSYMVGRYGFNAACKVVAFTGDNPSSLAGMRLGSEEMVVSLGSSDTVFLVLDQPKPSLCSCVFVNPITPTIYMAMLCYKNGSLTRERVRKDFANGSWEEFDACLAATKPGNDDNIGFYYDVTEITPHMDAAVYLFNGKDERVQSFDKNTHVRAIIESQAMAKRNHAENIGYKKTPNMKILATGGASANKNILQVLADVFANNVFVADIPNSASVGAAYRAKHGVVGGRFEDVIKGNRNIRLAATPKLDAVQKYEEMMKRYTRLEKVCEDLNKR